MRSAVDYRSTKDQKNSPIPDTQALDESRERDLVYIWSADSPTAFAAEWREMFVELYQYRELLAQMILRDIKIRYKQAMMGFAWAIFMPILIVAAGCLVKIALAHASGSDVALPRIAGMAVKALGWAFFAGSLGFAANSLITNMALVTKVYFPRELFPLSAVITQLCDTCIGAISLCILLFIFSGLRLSFTWLWLPLLTIVLVSQAAAVALLFSCANVFFRDVKYIIQVLLTFGIFFTPVFYEPELFGPHGAFMMMLNPLSPLLEGLRLALIEGHNLLTPVVASTSDGVPYLTWHIGFLGYATVTGLMGLLLSWWLFHRSEYLFAEYV